jgi:hypothetical protein
MAPAAIYFKLKLSSLKILSTFWSEAERPLAIAKERAGSTSYLMAWNLEAGQAGSPFATSIEVSVLIMGGGAVGMTSSILCAKQEDAARRKLDILQPRAASAPTQD